MQGSTLLKELLSRGLITEDQSLVVKTESSRGHCDVESALLASGFVDGEILNTIKADGTGLKPVLLGNLLADAAALELINLATARRYRVFPVFLDQETEILDVAISSPHDVLVKDAINSYLHGRCEVRYCFAALSEIEKAIETHYELELSIEGIVQELSGQGRGSDRLPEDSQHPIVRLANAVIMEAFRQRASDIHFEPESGFFRIRYRVDGVLRVSRTIHCSHWPATATRLKVMAGLNIAETRDAQDGAFNLAIGATAIDVRISVFPTLHGENIVLRLLDPATARLDLDEIGFSGQARHRVQQAVLRPQGMTLLVGPTGCGKTTTLYALLNHLADESVNVMTLEDPVEYQLPLVRQCAVNSSNKLTFASGIRSILRQDPDIILVGEIRDEETAELSIRAAMTGHHVLATMHTTSVLGVYRRLIELGIQPALVYESVSGIVSQRLLRLMCRHCRVESPVVCDDSALKSVECRFCQGSGYLGRTAIAETLISTPQVQALLEQHGTGATMLAELHKRGHIDLQQAAMELVTAGLTDQAELGRIFGHTPVNGANFTELADPAINELSGSISSVADEAFTSDVATTLRETHVVAAKSTCTAPSIAIDRTYPKGQLNHLAAKEQSR